MQQILQNPLAALDRRSPIGVGSDQQHAALPKKAAPGIARDGNTAEVRSVDTGNAVMPGETFVDEGVIGVEQIQNRSVFMLDAFKKHFGFPLERLPKIIVEIGKFPAIGIRALQIPEIEPLAGEVGREGARPRIREHAARLMLEHGGVVQLVPNGERQQFIVGYARPQKKRQARREFRIADSVRPVRKERRRPAARSGRRIPGRLEDAAHGSRYRCRHRSCLKRSVPADRS